MAVSAAAGEYTKALLPFPQGGRAFCVIIGYKCTFLRAFYPLSGVFHRKNCHPIVHSAQKISREMKQSK